MAEPSALGIPRTADGKPNLIAPAPRAPDGEPDLSGIWSTSSDRYYNNITVDLKSEDVMPWADALHRQRLRGFGKDAMETLCLPSCGLFGDGYPRCVGRVWPRRKPFSDILPE